jgi:hypothetical protein
MSITIVTHRNASKRTIFLGYYFPKGIKIVFFRAMMWNLTNNQPVAKNFEGEGKCSELHNTSLLNNGTLMPKVSFIVLNFPICPFITALLERVNRRINIVPVPQIFYLIQILIRKQLRGQRNRYSMNTR